MGKTHRRKDDEAPDGMALAEGGAAADDTAVAVADAPAESDDVVELRARLAELGNPEADMRAAADAYATHKLAHEAAVKAGDLRLLELQTAKRRAERDGGARLEQIRVIRKRLAALGV